MSAPVDVIVVGAGPIGLALACRLVLSGLRVRVLERDAAARRHSRSIGIHPPALDALAEIGVADRLVRLGVAVEEGMAIADGRVLGRLSFERCPPPYRFVLSIPQWLTEEVLEARLRELDPDSLERGVVVIGVGEDPDSVRVQASDGRRFEASWLVGCDGSDSTVRRSLGVPVRETDYADRYVMGDFLDDTGFGQAAAIFLSGSGLVESFPLPGNGRRWVVRIDRPAEAPLADTISGLVLERTGHRPDSSTATMTSAFGVRRALADRLATSRVLLAGDAAHVVSPIGGQGMNLGWLGSRDAALAIAQAHADPMERDHLLAAYSDRWRRVARRVARRAEFNMFFGRPSALMPVRRLVVRGMLAGPWSSAFARRFTMRGL